MTDSGPDSSSTGTGSASSSAHNSPTPGRGLAAAGSSNTRIGSLHATPTAPGGRLASLRGAHGGGGGAGGGASTRGGATKIKFTPTVPSKRNKKDAAPSLLDESRAGSSDTGRGLSGRGRGERGRGRGGRGGRGGSRGGFGHNDEAATASGPFSLGPSAAGNRWASKHQQMASRGGGSASGAHSSYTGVQGVKVERASGDDDGLTGDDREYYGDAVIDMKFGSGTADASLPTGAGDVDLDAAAAAAAGGARVKQEMTEDGVLEGEETLDVKPKIEGPAQDLLPAWQEDQMFFFQFPSVVPNFKPRPLPAMMEDLQLDDSTPGATETDPDLVKVKAEPEDGDMSKLKSASGLVAVKKEEEDTPKLGSATASPSTAGGGPPAGQRAKPKATPGGPTMKAASEDDGLSEAPLAQEGKIGRLLVYKSGKVKMQVGDIVMDVTTGSECTFLQDLVVVDSSNKQAFVMGSVQKRMICVPNLEQLLAAVENNQADQE
ncbi:hypothetical protein DFQ26_005965 [Actinomortierella ambigua]|nr:hypothetical protein DFQ26_005965 [Actinomortierella ambigua]